MSQKSHDNHQFLELGRFAVAYRSVFGEMPSATLRRSSDQNGLIRAFLPKPHSARRVIREDRRIDKGD